MKNIKNFDVTIIGGGASGLFCAALIKSKAPYLSVAILEKQKSVGKKLLATGNGRCNLTNIYATKEMYHGTFSSGVSHLLEVCPPDMIINIFEGMGLLTTIDNEGRVYPLSKSSASVLDVLTLNCKNSDIKIHTEAFATSIKKNNSCYEIECDCFKIHTNYLVIASGSKATPETGADDSIISSIATLGHRITELKPALCPVCVKSKVLNILKGVRATGKVTILKNNKAIKTEYGEIQFTDKALSGICIFNLSRIANTESNTTIAISLLPDKNRYDILTLLKTRIKAIKENSLCEDILCGVFNRKIIYALLKEAGITKEQTVMNLSDKDINKLADLIDSWCFDVIPSRDFTRAQVVSGGVHGEEINCKTMESKISKNLYIIGEAVDCDGDCGGLNLQFAFSSAYCAALDITK